MKWHKLRKQSYWRINSLCVYGYTFRIIAELALSTWLVKIFGNLAVSVARQWISLFKDQMKLR